MLPKIERHKKRAKSKAESKEEEKATVIPVLNRVRAYVLYLDRNPMLAKRSLDRVLLESYIR